MNIPRTRSSRRHVASEHQGRAQLWAFFALIVYVPLPLGSNRPWALALLGLLTGGLLLWNIWCPSGRSPAWAWRSARIPLILMLLWMLLLVIQLIPVHVSWLDWLTQRTAGSLERQSVGSDSISIDSYSTRLYLAKACILAAVFWLVVVLVDSSRRIESLAKVIVFSGLLQAMIGVVVMATGANFVLFFVEIFQPRGHGTFVSPNNFAGYLELTLAVGIGLMIAKLDGREANNWNQRLHGWLALLISEKALLRLSLIIMVVGLVASRSRMGNAAFFASLLIVGVFTVIFSKRAMRRMDEGRNKNTLGATVLFIASLIVLDMFIIGGVVGVEQVAQRLELTNLKMQVGDEVSASGLQLRRQEESVEERAEAAKYALPIISDFPLLGTGGGTFHLAFQHYQPAGLEGYWDHAHNDFVEFASEVGLLGMLLLASLVSHSVLFSLGLLQRSHDQFSRGMAFASLMGITSLLIHGAVDFNFQIPANAMLFLIVLCLPYLAVILKR